MSEFRSGPELLPRRMGEFKNVLQTWQQTPPSGDIYIAAFAQATSESFNSDTPLHAFFNELLASRDIGASSLATKTLRATQRQLLFGDWDTANGEYPRAFHTAEQWNQAFDWIFAEPGGIREEQFFTDIWTRPLQSNVSERYQAIKLFTGLARRLGRLSTVSLLDIGCSQNAGANHLASGLAFPAPNVFLKNSDPHTPDIPHTAAAHSILAEDLGEFDALGIDMYSPDDSWQWAWSCSHYPAELLDERRVERLYSLMRTKFSNVGFFQANAASFEPRSAAFAQQHSKRKFNVAFASTILNAMSPEERDGAIDFAEANTTDVLLVQDFVRIDPHNPTKLDFSAQWHGTNEPFPYRTVGRDMRSGDERWQPYFSWSDGRMRRLRIDQGRIAIGATSKTSDLWTPLHELANQRAT